MVAPLASAALLIIATQPIASYQLALLSIRDGIERPPSPDGVRLSKSAAARVFSASRLSSVIHPDLSRLTGSDIAYVGLLNGRAHTLSCCLLPPENAQL